MRVGPQCDRELVAEDQVFEREIPARSDGSNDGTESEERQLEHPSG